MRFTVEELAALTGGTVLRPPRRPGPVQPVSRYRRLSPEACYFPIRRLPNPAEEALFLREKQPSVVVEHRHRRLVDLSGVPGAGVIVAPSPWRAYFRVAAEARNRSGALVVGVTGSSGKSTTTEFVAAALARRFRVVTNHGSHNACLDCCDVLLDLEGTGEGTGREAAVIEMGFDQAGDVARMARTARPDIGIITNVTEAHLAGAGGDWATLVHEKGRLGEYVRAGGCLLVSADDPGCRILTRVGCACEVRSFGYAAGADARLLSVRAGETGLRVSLDCLGRRLDLSLRVFGEWHAANAAAAVLAAHLAGVPPAEVKDALEAKPPPSHRFSIHRFDRGLTVIDDTFNATVDAMERGLYAAARLAGRRRKIAFLGGVKRLGGRSRDLHRRLGLRTARLGYEHVVLLRRGYGEGFREGLLAGGLGPERIRAVVDFEAAPAAILPLLGPDTLLYCKAENAGPEVDVVLQRLQQAGWERLG